MFCPNEVKVKYNFTQFDRRNIMDRDTKLLILLVASMFLLTSFFLSQQSFPTPSPVPLKPLGNATTIFENVKLVLQTIHLVVVIVVYVIGILATFGFFYRRSNEEVPYIQKIRKRKRELEHLEETAKYCT